MARRTIHLKIGDTLSQRALAVRFYLSPSTIRRRGNTVWGFVTRPGGKSWFETWDRVVLIGSSRTFCYELREIDGG